MIAVGWWTARLALGGPAECQAEVPPPYVKQLEAYGLSPTKESLGGYLDSLHPSPEQQARVQKMVQQLGHPDYREREAAMRSLLRRPAGITAVLEDAVAGDDAEIRWRARQILERTDREGRALLHAALTTIQREKIGGLAEPVLRASTFCEEGYLHVALRHALAATATQADVPLLRRALKSPESRTRIAGLQTLDVLVGENAATDALALLGDESEIVQCAAARVLAGRGRRESLDVLVELLRSSDMPVRLEAYRTLRSLTGQQFGYTVYDKQEKRAAAVAEWTKWLETSGASAPLHLPLRDLPPELGRLLVCDPAQSKLIEFDAGGEKIWEQAVGQQPWACHGLPNGHRLVGSYNERSIVEYDGDGKEIWRIADLPGGPTGVERIENGNTLVACTEGGQVVEIDPTGRTVWRASLDGRPVDAHRLDDGRTLVALQNAQKVVEVDTSGKVVWEISGVGMAFSVQRLPDGNTLVCSLNTAQVREYDPSGKVVWSQGNFTNPYTAQRLADGNTIVVDRDGVTEMDSHGATVRKISIANPSRAWRY